MPFAVIQGAEYAASNLPFVVCSMVDEAVINSSRKLSLVSGNHESVAVVNAM